MDDKVIVLILALEDVTGYIVRTEVQLVWGIRPYLTLLYLIAIMSVPTLVTKMAVKENWWPSMLSC